MSLVPYVPNQMETVGHSEHVAGAVHSLGPWQWDPRDDVSQLTMTPLSIHTANTQTEINNLSSFKHQTNFALVHEFCEFRLWLINVNHERNKQT